MIVKLDDIKDGMESQSDEAIAYFSKKTGKVVRVTDEELRAAEDGEPMEDFPKWQHENIRTAREILETDDYISLPSRFDIHEYAIVERFCLSIADADIRDNVYRTIKGKGAFRRFRESIYRYNVAEDWYKYRDETIKQIAIDWCKENDIEFRDRGRGKQ